MISINAQIKDMFHHAMLARAAYADIRVGDQFGDIKAKLING